MTDISVKRQADAVQIQILGLRDVLKRRSNKPAPMDDLTAIRIVELEAAERTLRFIDADLDDIRTFLQERKNARP